MWDCIEYSERSRGRPEWYPHPHEQIEIEKTVYALVDLTLIYIDSYVAELSPDKKFYRTVKYVNIWKH